MPDAAAPAGLEALDWSRSLAQVDHDIELLAHLLRVFNRQFAATAGGLREAVVAQDWRALSSRCHQLAGAAGALGAVRLDAQARAVDLAARAAAGLPLPPDRDADAACGRCRADRRRDRGARAGTGDHDRRQCVLARRAPR